MVVDQDNSSLETNGDGQLLKTALVDGGGTSRSLLWAGVTDADQSPTLPASFAVEERKMKTHLKHLYTTLQVGANHETAIEVAEKKLATYITDEVTDVATDVNKLNIKDTDSIGNVEPTHGAPGPPGYHGTNGHHGLIGLTGPTGSKGRTGPRGGAGHRGVVGVSGDQGPIGHEGPGGFSGMLSKYLLISTLLSF
jgi:hypothetical protein